VAQRVRFGTARGVIIGPAIATGGHAFVTGLTAANVTALRIIKNSATISVTVTGRTFAHIHKGHYRIALLSGDFNTHGHLRAFVHASGTPKALAFWQDFEVVPANVYDSTVSGGDRLQVDAREWAGAATATGDVALNTRAEVWAATGRTLTSGLVVWAVAARALTDKAAFSLVTGQHDSIGTRVWAVTTRVLTSAAVVWTAAARGLTSKIGFSLVTTQHDAIGARVWVQTARTLTSAGVAWSAAARTLTSAAVVWTAAARGLTSKVGFALTTGQHDAIGARAWAPATRTLTSGGNVASSVWGRSLTDVTGAPAGSAAGTKLSYIYVGARYKRVTTATGDKLHSAASAVIAKAPISASSTVFTRGKFVTATA
jgi:hypothetical protein